MSSKRTYASGIRVYESVLSKHDIFPYTITIEKIRGFLMSKKKEGKKYNTLHGYISAFSNYFEQNSLYNLTKDIKFKNFKSVLRRVMKITVGILFVMEVPTNVALMALLTISLRHMDAGSHLLTYDM